MFSRSMVRTLVFAGIVGSVISACDGNSATVAPTTSASTAPATSTVPVIANITANFSTNSCIRPADGLHAIALVISFRYTDGTGDLSSGSVQLNRLYNTGRSESHVSPVPSAVTLSGTPTSGQLTISNACPFYDDATSSIETLVLIDANGSASNPLSVMVNRLPGGP